MRTDTDIKKVIRNITVRVARMGITRSLPLNRVQDMMMRRQCLRRGVNLVMIRGRGVPILTTTIVMIVTQGNLIIYTMIVIITRVNGMILKVRRHPQIEYHPTNTKTIYHRFRTAKDFISIKLKHLESVQWSRTIKQQGNKVLHLRALQILEMIKMQAILSITWANEYVKVVTKL